MNTTAIMENILFNTEVRKKRKNWWRFFMFFSSYYEREDLSLKEKLYTFWYNLERTGLTTKGESEFGARMSAINPSGYKNLENQFKKDYWEYINN